MGFSASAILGYCAALMFVVIIAHISLRANLGAPQGIIYLEYIYFVTYGAILSVSLNAIIFAAAPDIRLFQYRDNLVGDVAFWPTVFGLLLAFTMLAFLSQIAVGTVDQAMMGALKVRHGHMRAACLARNLLVVDEVHASDTYMRAIIEALPCIAQIKLIPPTM